MAFDMAHIWASMGTLGKSVALVLLIMGIASAGVTVERLIALAKSKKESRRFAAKAGPMLEAWDLEGLLAACETHKASALAKLFQAIVQRYTGARSGNVSPVELARSESERALEGAGADLRRGLSVLASVGSVAPFVGLLGTVVGIIGAFQGIASTGSGGLGAVSAGIAEALIETAFGLMVAIPAVLLFNWLTGKINAVELTLNRSAGELLDEIENNHGREAKPFSEAVRQAA
ncbi:MAG: MotA/TolQ/ExbB proton channel family protein [Polyangiaceae bacterium]